MTTRAPRHLSGGIGYVPSPPIVFERVETHFEYQTVESATPLATDALKPLGRDGWILAAVATIPGASPRFAYHFVRVARD